jgi:hypothetical protein
MLAVRVIATVSHCCRVRLGPSSGPQVHPRVHGHRAQQSSGRSPGRSPIGPAGPVRCAGLLGALARPVHWFAAGIWSDRCHSGEGPGWET